MAMDESNTREGGEPAGAWREPRVALRTRVTRVKEAPTSAARTAIVGAMLEPNDKNVVFTTFNQDQHTAVWR